MTMTSLVDYGSNSENDKARIFQVLFEVEITEIEKFFEILVFVIFRAGSAEKSSFNPFIIGSKYFLKFVY